MLRGKKTTVWLLIFIVFLVIISVVPAVGLSNKKKANPSENLTTFEKIESAEKEGKISKDRKILYKAQAIFAPHSLPKTFKGKPSKEGTMVLLEVLKSKGNIKDKKIRQKINTLTNVKNILPKKLYRKLYRGADYDASVTAAANTDEPIYLNNLTLSTSSTHFQVWYTNTGTDAVNTDDLSPDGGTTPPNGIPDYVDDMLESLEEVWEQEINVMDYREPEGSSEKFQVFLKDLGDNYYGLAAPVNETGTYKYDAFLVIENNFSGFPGNAEDNLAVTAAHEFFHAIQFAYNNFDSDWDYINGNWGPNAWWMEATATWMEDEVYPEEINDYLQYLYALDEFYEPDGWFAWPEQSLTTFDGWREYGSVMFPKYLQRRSGQSIIRTIWENTDGINLSTQKSIRSIIGERYSSTSPGTAFNNIYLDFMVQNYIIHKYDPETYDPETYDPEYDPAPTLINPGPYRYSTTDAYDISTAKSNEWGTDEDYPFFIWERSSIDTNINGPLSKSITSSNPEAPEYLGTNYNVINAPSSAKPFEFRFDSTSTSNKWAVKLLLKKRSTGYYQPYTLVSTGGTSGKLPTSYFGQNSTYDKAIIVASSVGPGSNIDSGRGYTYRGRYKTSASIYAYPYKVKKGSKVKLYGQVTPKPNGYIRIERLYSTGWKVIKWIHPSSLTSAGRFTWYWTTPTKTGKYKIRVRFTGSSTYADSLSTYRIITVY